MKARVIASLAPTAPDLLGVLIIAVATWGCGSDGDPSSGPSVVVEPATTTTFEFGAVRVSLPAGFTPVGADESAEIRRSTLGGRTPPGSYRVSAQRLDDRDAIVVIQHESVPLVASGGEVVRDYLDEVLQAFIERERAAGDWTEVSERARDGGLEQCGERLTGDGPHARSCTLAYIDRDRGHIVINVLSCTGDTATRDAVCRSVLDSREYSIHSPSALSGTLEATHSPGLAELEPSSLLWMRFGMSRQDFQEACRGANERVDEVDLTRQPPAVQSWFRQGKMSTCSGLGSPFSLGDVTNVHAAFHVGGGLAELTIFLTSRFETTSERVRAAYPDYLVSNDSTTHFINRNARDYDILGATVSPSRSRPAFSMLVIQSRAALDNPPL